MRSTSRYQSFLPSDLLMPKKRHPECSHVARVWVWLRGSAARRSRASSTARAFISRYREGISLKRISVASMLVGMEKLGNITNRIVAKLIAERENKNDGGTAEQGRSTSAAAKCPPGRSARPQVKGAAIGHDRTIALTAGERVAAAPKAGRTRAAAVRFTARGESRTGNRNVIDYREHLRLLVAWGAHQPAPYGALPKHPKRPRRERRERAARTQATAPQLPLAPPHAGG